jgi:hypothetical protein
VQTRAFVEDYKRLIIEYEFLDRGAMPEYIIQEVKMYLFEFQVKATRLCDSIGGDGRVYAVDGLRREQLRISVKRERLMD